jgi:catechol 2,3-dioxygenase-like lactoylglutathione lyase family enzyme
MKMKLEVVFVPVTDVDRAKAFYVEKLGFSADHDQRVNEKLRFVQLTPEGSACSIAIGEGLTDMVPGTLKDVMMVIDNAQEAHDTLKAKGVEVSDIETQAWGKFIYFSDPDGNSWTLQELPDYSQTPPKQTS